MSMTIDEPVEVPTNIFEDESNSSTVVSSPAANVMLCAPAGNTAVAVVHTMLNVATVIVHVAVSVAVPDALTSTPAGFVLAEK